MYVIIMATWLDLTLFLYLEMVREKEEGMYLHNILPT